MELCWGQKLLTEASDSFERGGYLFSPYACWLHILPAAQLRDSEEVCFKQARQEAVWKALFRHYTKQEDKAQIWLAENLKNKVMSKTKQSPNVFRGSFTGDHKLIYSFPKKPEEILVMMCFI